jgi:hypothetical protein
MTIRNSDRPAFGGVLYLEKYFLSLIKQFMLAYKFSSVFDRSANLDHSKTGPEIGF